MDPPSPPARIHSGRSSPNKATVDVAMPESRSSQSSLWLDRSLHLPDFPSSRHSSRLSSVAMVSQSAAAEELARATMEYEASRSRRVDRPSARLASMAQSFNVENDNYRRKYEDSVKERVALEEANSKVKRELQDARREVDDVKNTLAKERAEAGSLFSQHSELKTKFMDLKVTSKKQVDAAEEEVAAIRAELNANTHNYTQEIAAARQEANQTAEERVSRETQELRKDVANLATQMAALRENLQRADLEIGRLEGELDDSQRENEKLECLHAAKLAVVCGEAEARIAKVEEIAHQWERDCEEQGSRLVSLQEEIHNKNSVISQHKQETARILMDFDSYKEECARQKADAERHHSAEMDIIRGQLKDSEDCLAYFKSECAKKDELMRQMHTDQKRLAANLKELTENAACFKAKAEEKHIQLQDLRGEYDVLNENYENVCEKLLQRYEDSNRGGGSSEDKAAIEKLKQEHADAERQWQYDLAQSKRREEEYSARVTSLKAEITVLEDSLSESLTATSNVSNAKLLRAELSALGANYASVQRQLDESRDKCAQLRSDISRYQSQIDELERNQGPTARPIVGYSTAVVECDEPTRNRVRGEKAPRAPLENIPHNQYDHHAITQQQRPSSLKDVAAAKPAKKAIFAITGISAGGPLVESLSSIRGAEVRAVPSDAPIPADVTHIISNGNLTVKVLTALVRGCWVLPPTYVSQCGSSLAPEGRFGFRHEDLPLAGKVIGMTAGFRQSSFGKHLQEIAQEGGATIHFINMTTDDAASFKRFSFVACLKAEMPSFPSNGKTWESFVQMIFPPTVQEVLKKESSSFMPTKGGPLVSATASIIPSRSAPASVAPIY